jgi:predicted nucleic acid-binding protein
MMIFADTSALFALLVRNDYMHVRAKLNFEHFAATGMRLLTSSYVLLETTALLQRRVGLEAVWSFDRKIMPLLEIEWVESDLHGRAVRRLQMENNRQVSLTDCLSFEIMEAREIHTAFAFDEHFSERGFKIAAFHDLNR